MTFINVHACLVHEAPECVTDLVRNLQHLDPSSKILLYDGSPSGDLHKNVDLASHDAIWHPSPRPMMWGDLHDFATDCLHFATTHLHCDAMTVVDSDQLALRPGYGEHLEKYLARYPNAGLLGSRAQPVSRHERKGPTVQAWKEFELWRQWLTAFSNGIGKFPYWTFWPGTVITASAGRELVRLLKEDRALQAILTRSKMWAVEEVLFPTLVALLGFDVIEGPASRQFMRFRVQYTSADIESALVDPGVFFIHPILRRLNDPLRIRIRRSHDQYQGVASASANVPRLLQALPVLKRMSAIDGWFAEEEGDLLLASARQALLELGRELPLVEIGSYCGRSTVLLGEVARVYGDGNRVIAIDPHDGVVGAQGQNLEQLAPTFEVFCRNIATAGLQEVVDTICRPPYQVTWQGPIALLHIDGLHDYDNVARDFHHFENHVPEGGYVAFHDYAPYYPGVQTLVDEVVASGFYEWEAIAGSLAVLRKRRVGMAKSNALIIDDRRCVDLSMRCTP